MAEYVVMTPPFARNSAGIRFLNQLTDDLRSIGRTAHRVYSVTTDKGLLSSLDGKTWYHHTPDLLKRLLNLNNEFIVIHGENQDCKYFEGLNVARYYLNRIGALMKMGIPREGEFKITWIPEFCDQPHFVLRSPTVRYPLEAATHVSLDNRQIDLTYVGKGVLKGVDTPRIPHTLEVKKDWPNNDDEYFYLLKNTRRLYTYDSVTSVIEDAIVLGALPVLLLDRFEGDILRGCIAHIDDDVDAIAAGFEVARRRFLDYQIDLAAQYKSNLEQCCVAMEEYFG